MCLFVCMFGGGGGGGIGIVWGMKYDGVGDQAA